MHHRSDKALIGPFTQIVTLEKLKAGALKDEQLKIIPHGGIVIKDGYINEIGAYDKLKSKDSGKSILYTLVDEDIVALPGLIDAHTHICFAGSRANDYALRSAGKSYLDIARAGGGILTTVKNTRAASQDELVDELLKRCDRLIYSGVTTCEVKSGYGLTVEDELKMLRAINFVNNIHAIDLIATALPAHVCPPEFTDPKEYLEVVQEELFPEIKKQKLASRVDIFIEDSAFSVDLAEEYLKSAKAAGFDLTIHADQFSTVDSKLAVKYKAISADHLEASGSEQITMLAAKHITGTVLPGASIGLGMPFAPARKMLDAGMTLAIASDWNPGSAPMGDVLLQSCILGMYEKLTLAEILAGLTVNAAHALKLADCGILKQGNKADIIGFPCKDYREIFYQQGKMLPIYVWKDGRKVK